MLLSILKGSQKPFIRNWPFGKLLSIFVSEIIGRSTLLARYFARNSKWKTRDERSDFIWLVSVQNVLLLDLFPAKLLLTVTSPSVLRKTHCHWNLIFLFDIWLFDISRTNVAEGQSMWKVARL